MQLRYQLSQKGSFVKFGGDEFVEIVQETEQTAEHQLVHFCGCVEFWSDHFAHAEYLESVVVEVRVTSVNESREV